MRGDHAPLDGPARSPLGAARLTVPVDAPAGLLNRVTLALFNEAYYRGQLRADARSTSCPTQPFFFPLDGMGDWTRLYGPRGFVQYQCVVPGAPAAAGPSGRSSSASRARGRRPRWRCSSDSALSARRACSPSLGRASPWPWTSPSAATGTFALLDDLDAIVREAGGAVYPAKDARMSPASFRAFFPELDRSVPTRTPSSPPRSGGGCMRS